MTSSRRVVNVNEVEETIGIVRAAVVLAQDDLPPETVAEVWDLLDHAEPGVALDAAVAQLYDYDRSITPSVRDLFAVAARRMGMEVAVLDLITIREER